ncbi:SWIM zinc finger domain-containing protein [Parapedobacter deserti]|uniref:SWIM zinc finger domain-containing protein n=1 Tax=Parapedobacter deserti TaxID=1912957 RepID=A0ABV7JGS9_9SPHI
MLTLANFEEKAPKGALDAGKLIFQQDDFDELVEYEDNVWLALVRDKEVYQVDVILSGDAITIHECQCPGGNKLCRHKVAVWLELRKQKGIVAQENTLKPAVPKKRRNLKKLVQDVSLEEFRQFVLDYAARHKGFKADFELYFAGREGSVDAGQHYADAAKKIVQKYTRQGFINYRASGRLAKELSKLASDGKQLLERGNMRDAYALVSGTLPVAMDAVTKSDDSSGYLGTAIHLLLDLLESLSASPSAPIDLKQELFRLVDQELRNPIYHEYGDFYPRAFRVFKQLALMFGEHDAFLEHVDEQLPLAAGYITDYRTSFLLTAKIDYLAETGRSDEAAGLIDGHLNLPAVRMRKLERVLATNDFKQAKTLIAEGIALAEAARHPGVTSTWETQLLRVAQLENDLPTIRQQAKKLALDGRGLSPEHYRAWKATYSPDEWTAVINEHIEAVTRKATEQWMAMPAHYRTEAPLLLIPLGRIFIEEGYWDRLLHAVQQENRLDTTTKYHEALLPRYPDELVELYLRQLDRFADQASNRRQYQQLVGIMLKVVEDIPTGKPRIAELAQALYRHYSFRRALQDELVKFLQAI